MTSMIAAISRRYTPTLSAYTRRLCAASTPSPAEAAAIARQPADTVSSAAQPSDVIEPADSTPDPSANDEVPRRAGARVRGHAAEHWRERNGLRRPVPPSLPSVPPTQDVFWTVGAHDDGARLDRYIKRKAPSLPTGFIQKLIRQRSVLINDVAATHNKTGVQISDRVKIPGHIKLGFSRGKRKPPLDDVSLAESDAVRSWVLHRDARTVVLNKPTGVPTQPAGPSLINPIVWHREANKINPAHRVSLGKGDGPLGLDGRRCVQDLLSGLGQGHYWLVHRLDTNVSGCLVVARDVGAAGILAEHFRNRAVEKVYWALVQGWFKEKEGSIQIPIDGKRAYTAYRTVHRVDNRYAWVELRPRTGRKHQLRIHCAEGLGCPIIGDVRYGAQLGTESDSDEDALGLPLHLVARTVHFPTLVDSSVGALRRREELEQEQRAAETENMRSRRKGSKGGPKWVTVDAPLPPHMKDTFKRLGLDESWAKRSGKRV